MKRREMLLKTGAALAGLSALPLRRAVAQSRRQRVLYFTRSVGFEHSVVARKDGNLSHSEKILTALGREHDVDVQCTKDGRVFDGDLSQYDAISFYTCGDLLNPESKDGAPPMTPAGKQNLLEAVAGGTGFVGFHSAADSFHSKGPSNAVQTEVDPYIGMLGGEFIKHGPQQTAKMIVTGPGFPGAGDLGDSFDMHEEWYALKNFAPDLHVILVQETKGMEGNCYQRPSFPATWAHMHGKGRVFYTSLGHREDVWTSDVFRDIVLGGFGWAMSSEEVDLTPNLRQAAPRSNELSAEL